MNPTLRQRALIGVAIGLALWSAWSMFKPADVVAPESSRRVRQPAPAQSAAALANAPAPKRLEAARAPLALRDTLNVVASRNPFDANPWVAKRVMPAPVVAVAPAPIMAAAAPPAPPAPPPPLQLPYRFLGTYAEKADSPSVFLAMGERLIVAKIGDTLDGGFRLDTVTPREITFTHIQQNVTLRLSVTGGPV